MLMHIIIFLIGLTALYFGSEWLVKGSSRLAKSLHIRPIIIGVTIVAFASSAPEAVVSLVAALKKNSDIALGNILGSVIANIGLVLGFSAIISPLRVQLSVIRKELPIMMGATILFYLMALNLSIGFGEGLLLFMGIILFITYSVYQGLKEKDKNQLVEKEYEKFLKGKKDKRIKFILLSLVGLILIIGGANLLIKSAIFLAQKFGVSELIIGITLVAVGTSMPELAISAVAAYRKEADISAGNVIGSNIFNIFFVIGAVAMIHPLIIEKNILGFEFPAMLVFSLLLLWMMKTNLTLSRTEGVILLGLYILFLGILQRNAL
ncbi:MAG: calcium/sodium antiporter [Candidatus Zixiibacteriota bacterium]